MSTPRPRAAAACVAALLLLALVAAQARAADTIPGRVVVKFASGQRAAAIDRANVDLQSVTSVPGFPGAAVLQLKPGESATDAVRTLKDTPGVDYAYQDARAYTFAGPDDPAFVAQDQWALSNVGQPIGGTGQPPDNGTAGADIDALDAWTLSTGSRSVRVGVVDNGVDATHPDLSANVDASLGGDTFVDPPTTGSGSGPDTGAVDSFHGTHVAGIIGAVGNNGLGIAGINWAVTMIPVAALGCCATDPDTGDQVSTGGSVGISRGLSMASDAGARVVNASLGTAPGAPEQVLETSAVANHQNTLFVFAAGNDFNDNDQDPVWPCNIAQPNVICVARSQADDRLAFDPSAGSNYGAHSVQLAAPGGRIISTVPVGTPGADCTSSCLAYENGTSMAAPMVSGVAGLILARNPWSSTAQVKDAILSSVDPLPNATDRSRLVTGGRLNAYKALLASDDTVPPAAFSLSAPGDGTSTNSATANLAWTGSSDAKSGLDHYDVLVDGSQVATTGQTSASVPLGDGAHTIAVRAVDRAGNVTTTPSETITVDRAAPSNPGGGSPLNGSFVTTTRPGIGWTPATDGGSGIAGYDVSFDGGPATRVSAATTSFTPATALAQGAHRWVVQAVDRAGNASGGLTGTFFVDTVAPDQPGRLKPDGTSTDDRTPRLTWGSVSDAVSGLAFYELSVDERGAAERVEDPGLTITEALKDGSHTWTVRAVDIAGNVSPRATGVFRVDTRAPRASASAASAGAGRLRVRCRTTEAGTCTVKVVASSATAKRLHLGRKSVTLGQASASLKAPGRSLTVRLSSKARSALRRFGRARVIVRVTVADSAGNAVRKTVSATAR